MQTYTYTMSNSNETQEIIKLHYCLDKEALCESTIEPNINSLLQQQYDVNKQGKYAQYFTETLFLIEEKLILNVGTHEIRERHLQFKQINDPNLIEEQEGENFNEKLKNTLTHQYHFETDQIYKKSYVGSSLNKHQEYVQSYSKPTYLLHDGLKALQAESCNDVDIIDSSVQFDPIVITEDEISNSTNENIKKQNAIIQSINLLIFFIFKLSLGIPILFIFPVYLCTKLIQYLNEKRLNLSYNANYSMTANINIDALREEYEKQKLNYIALSEEQARLETTLKDEFNIEKTDKISLLEEPIKQEKKFDIMLSKLDTEDLQESQYYKDNITRHNEEIAFYKDEMHNAQAQVTQLQKSLNENQTDSQINQSYYKDTYNKTLYLKGMHQITSLYYTSCIAVRQQQIAHHLLAIDTYKTKIKELQQKVAENELKCAIIEQDDLTYEMAIKNSFSSLRYIEAYLKNTEALEELRETTRHVRKQIWLHEQVQQLKSI